jgi:addiction module RelE/StbE family toxin
MEISFSTRFKRAYKKLPEHIQENFDAKIRLFIESPSHPQLRVHMLRGKLHECLSFSLRDGYRVLFDITDRHIVRLLDVGNHDSYAHWGK